MKTLSILDAFSCYQPSNSCYWNLKNIKASFSFSCHYVVFGLLVSVSSLISSISPQFILNLTPYLHLPVSPMFILLFFVADQLMCLYCHLMTPCKQFTIKVNTYLEKKTYLSHNGSRRMDGYLMLLFIAILNFRKHWPM